MKLLNFYNYVFSILFVSCKHKNFITLLFDTCSLFSLSYGTIDFSLVKMVFEMSILIDYFVNFRHTGVVCFGTEYCFGSGGIMQMNPVRCKFDSICSFFRLI